MKKLTEERPLDPNERHCPKVHVEDLYLKGMTVLRAPCMYGVFYLPLREFWILPDSGSWILADYP